MRDNSVIENRQQYSYALIGMHKVFDVRFHISTYR